ncbi:XRE family transcriptional regulator [Rhodococcus hoagii]|uniref:XRE family transcriptional regulator n=1 Tax=Rhodococcus hoagii TaxID=43767 RepID=A0A9Q4ZIM8_RHOHA|nr:XRE family transcriptional regulator [Prescottella equi]NKT77333.1 XRE family transcriptional regulator [Prescottella equi]NKZ81118.1 XRE family transcriptional regulator [Prescottella equi]
METELPRGQVAPEPWKSAMEKAGAISPKTKQASMNALARMCGVHSTTIQRIIDRRTGARGVEADTIQKIADALQEPPSVVAGWIGQVWGENEPYVPPKEADMLGPRERKALNEIIRSMAALQRETKAG